MLFSNLGYAFNPASLAYLAATVGARERKMRAAPFALPRWCTVPRASKRWTERDGKCTHAILIIVAAV